MQKYKITFDTKTEPIIARLENENSIRMFNVYVHFNDENFTDKIQPFYDLLDTKSNFYINDIHLCCEINYIIPQFDTVNEYIKYINGLIPHIKKLKNEVNGFYESSHCDLIDTSTFSSISECVEHCKFIFSEIERLKSYVSNCDY